MTKELWLNLPSKNLQASKTFYTSIGFQANDTYGNNPNMVGITISEKKIALMLFTEESFAGVLQNKVTDTAQSNEVIFSFSAATKQEVDEMAEKVTAAGGNVFAPPAEIQGWMYNCAFTDLDGHRWNILYLDMEKMPK